jgi:hypothetical protein
MRPTGGKSVWRAPDGGSNILNEVPVDLVANVLLQHVYSGTLGVVHASAVYYIPKTLKWMLEQPSLYLPPEWVAKMAKLVLFPQSELRRLMGTEREYILLLFKQILHGNYTKMINDSDGTI